MNIRFIIETFVVLAYIGMTVYAIYKYTKQNHDYKW